VNDYAFRIERGPLPDRLRHAVVDMWAEYDPRVRDVEHWRDEFERGPSGAALHAIVTEARTDRPVAHHAAIPIAFARFGSPVVIGKGEAIVVDRAHRHGSVTRDGKVERLSTAVARGLYEACVAERWAGYFGFATPAAEPRHLASGCQVVLLPVVPTFWFGSRAAARAWSADLPLRRPMRELAAMYAVAAGVRSRKRFRQSELRMRTIDIGSSSVAQSFSQNISESVIAFDPTVDQLMWRFPPHLYVTLAPDDGSSGYVVASVDRKTTRVVDWMVSPSMAANIGNVLREVARLCSVETVEWRVPATTPASTALATALGRAGVALPRRGAYKLLLFGEALPVDPGAWELTHAVHERF
jgi:hypothetical protein